MIPHFIQNLGFFALLFFILVFVHELGHFLMAKWVGIKVEKFAIGMGPSLFSFTKGETEYRLGILPLGGYVKMAGDDPSKDYTGEERQRGFLTKTPPQKLLVVFGGPVFNLLLPILLFGLMLSTGIPNLDPVIGTLESGKPAELSGVQPGDRVLKINGQAITKFQQIEKAIEKSGTEMMALELERVNLTSGEKEVVEISVAPAVVKTKSKFGEDIEAPRLGVSPEFSVPTIFFDTDKALVSAAGLKRFDRIVKLDQVTITTLGQLKTALEAWAPGEHLVTVDREGKKLDLKINLPSGADSVWKRLGLENIDLVISQVEPNSPAERAGLKKEDRLVSMNGQILNGFDEVAKQIRSSEGRPIAVVWSRSGEIMKSEIAAEKTTIDDPIMGQDNPLAREPVYRVGIGSARMVDTVMSMEQSLNPLRWISRGLYETWNMGRTTVEALYKLFTGQLSVKLLGSPIMIYKVAGNSYRSAGGGYMGWISFLSNLAMLSITLGLVNLLPVPVLDGGHATFFMIEWIRRKPVSLRFMEIAMQVGLFLLVALFGLVLVNDINRYQLFEPVLKLFR